MSERSDQLRAEAPGLPALPVLAPTLLGVLDACEQGDLPTPDLAIAVQRDPAIAVAVLAAAAPRADGPLRTVADALGCLDTEMVHALAVAMAAPALALADDRAAALAAAWRDAVGVALAARELARRVGYGHPEEAFLAGLLYDPGQFLAAVGEAGDGEGGRLSAGAFADRLESLRLGSFLDDALRYQEESADELADAHPLVRVLTLARRVSGRMNKGTAGDAELLFGLDGDALGAVFGEARSRAQDLAAELGLASDPGPEFAAAREQLVQRLGDLALLSALGLDAAEAADRAEVIQRGVRLITGARRTVLFVLDPVAGRLRGHAAHGLAKPVTELSAEVDPVRTLAAAALEDEQPRHSLDPDRPALSVVDRQLLRLLGSTGLIALPVLDGEGPVGVIVADLEPERLSTVVARLGTVRRFLAETAHVLRAPIAAGERAGARSLMRGVRVAAPRDPGGLRRLVHEINNPLSVVRNYLAVLDQKLGRTHAARQDLQVIGEELARAVGLLQRLVEDAPERRERVRQRTNLNRLVSDIVRVSAQAGPDAEAIKVRMQLDETLPEILTDADAVRQILLNLICNALEAMPDGGNLTVRTRDWFNVDGTPGVELQVSDSGPGLPETVRRDPFSAGNSTKGEGHAGLGLSVVRQLADELAGSLKFETSESGTTFCVLLPREVAPDGHDNDATTRTTTSTGADES